MATSKTLTPTNVTISIPEFTDQPDQRVNSNCIDKEADAINALNNNFGSTQSYTPTITSDSQGFAVSNISFKYMRIGKLLFVSGRFNITNVGSNPNNNTANITLPTGMSCADAVGGCGTIAVNTSGVDLSIFSVRQGDNKFYIQSGAGGSKVLGVIGTGYVMLHATIMLS